MRSLFGILALSVIISGCATTGMYSPTGMAGIYAEHTAPLAATGETSTKMGKACTSNILGVVAMGDGSIEAARKAGGISKVASVDIEYFNILFLYGTACTIVRGN